MDEPQAFLPARYIELNLPFQTESGKFGVMGAVQASEKPTGLILYVSNEELTPEDEYEVLTEKRTRSLPVEGEIRMRRLTAVVLPADGGDGGYVRQLLVEHCRNLEGDVERLREQYDDLKAHSERARAAMADIVQRYGENRSTPAEVLAKIAAKAI